MRFIPPAAGETAGLYTNLYNILIMEEMQTILACGAGASTKIYDDEIKQVRRIENVKNVKDYIERIDSICEKKRLMFK